MDRRITSDSEDQTNKAGSTVDALTIRAQFLVIDEKRLPVSYSQEQKLSVMALTLEDKLDLIDKKLNVICLALGIMLEQENEEEIGTVI